MIFAKDGQIMIRYGHGWNKKIGSDNVLEDYFLDLLVEKHIIDREIQDLLDVIEKSPIHPDYQRLMKKILFGEKIYISKTGERLRPVSRISSKYQYSRNDVASYGIVLRMMMRVIEEVFDVEDEYFHDFILSKKGRRRASTHYPHEANSRLCRKWSSWYDYHSEQLDEPIDDHIKDEFLIIKSALLQYPTEIMTSQKNAIEGLKIEVDGTHKNQRKKKNLSRLR